MHSNSRPSSHFQFQNSYLIIIVSHGVHPHHSETPQLETCRQQLINAWRLFPQFTVDSLHTWNTISSVLLPKNKEQESHTCSSVINYSAVCSISNVKTKPVSNKNTNSRFLIWKHTQNESPSCNVCDGSDRSHWQQVWWFVNIWHTYFFSDPNSWHQRMISVREISLIHIIHLKHCGNNIQCK